MNLEEAAKLSHSDWQQRAAELKKTAETRLSIIYSTWEGTWSRLNIIGSSGSARSLNGAGRLLEQ
jgi:hypothetical protein